MHVEKLCGYLYSCDARVQTLIISEKTCHSFHVYTLLYDLGNMLSNKVQNFVFTNNSLSIVHWTSVFTAISKPFSKLQCVNLHGSRSVCVSDWFAKLAHALQQSPVSNLCLSDTKMEDHHLMTFASVSARYVVTLNISENYKLTTDGIVAFITALSPDNKLKQLFFSDNEFSLSSIQQIVECIKTCRPILQIYMNGRKVHI